jgi:phage repressor protein C with HTH and peptisase S24 domain
MNNVSGNVVHSFRTLVWERMDEKKDNEGVFKQLSERVVWLRKNRGLNQQEAANALGIKYSTYQNIEYGRNKPNSENAKKIVDFYGCTLEWLLTGEGQPFSLVDKRAVAPDFPPDDFVFIRQVRGMISAGGGLSPDNAVDLMLAFRKDWIKRKGKPENMSLIKVQGDSMEPTLLSGDLVLVDHNKTTIAPQGGIYAISINHEIMIKRVQILFPEDRLRIISDNKQYEPIEAPADQVRVNGKVIWYARDMER